VICFARQPPLVAHSRGSWSLPCGRPLLTMLICHARHELLWAATATTSWTGGNRRAQIFHKAADYHAFVRLLRAAQLRVPMRVLSFCLMPNHFHLALWPYNDGDLSEWMGWLLTAHVRRYHQHYHSSGHVWQGRFRAFPIQEDEHLLTVLRYIERNALRANLVPRAETWAWSSLRWLQEPSAMPFLHPAPCLGQQTGLSW